MEQKTLVFSRDRAMQLDAVLRSFFLHCQDSEFTRIQVLYCASTDLHAQQYEILKEDYPQVYFVQQRDFRNDVLRILDPYPAGGSSQQIFKLLNQLISFVLRLERLPVRLLRSILFRLRVKALGRLIPLQPVESHILFLVDDNLFVRDFSLGDFLAVLKDHPDALGLSLRLGRNTTYCYTMNQSQSLPQFEIVQHGILKFDWTTSELDFAYPLEVSSSVYRSEGLFSLIAIQPFNNPNELEYQLAISANYFKSKNPFLLCPESSYTFCNPLNLVQSFASNRSSSNTEYSSEHLATLFEQGYRIDVKAYDGFTPVSCHQEVPLEFYKLDKDLS